MTFSIQWQDHCNAPQQCIQVYTPIAEMTAYVCADILCGLVWCQKKTSSLPDTQHLIQRQINHYWQNPTQTINIKLLKQGTHYRQKIWGELIQIPFAKTLNYQQLARKTASHARPVAGACRDNPYPLIIPCHRVLSSTGIGGYAGQSQGFMLNIKQQLLAYEASVQ